MRYRYLLIALVLSLCAFSGRAQGAGGPISRLQYFFNNDPGAGNAGNGAVLLLSAATDSLEQGFNISLPSSLGVGMHYIYIRVADTSGAWSLADRKAFYIVGADSLASVTAIQYYFNDDPGVGIAGNGAILNISPQDSLDSLLVITIPNTLSPGLNRLFIRVQDANGQWSLPMDRSFYVLSSTLASQLTALQYFFDEDPGTGNAGNGALINLNPAQALDSIISIDPPDTLKEGLHYLYIRTRDNQGRWSLNERKPFWIKDQEMITLAALEYFFDNDPGPGNANPYPLTATDSIDLTMPIGAPCLSQGQHLVFWRALASNGVWSIVGWDTLVMDTGVAPPVIVPAGPLSICDGDTVTLISTEIFGASYQWQKDGVDIPGADTTVLLVTETGSYALKVICSGSFTTSLPVVVNTDSLIAWYRDADGDGYGDPLSDSLDCRLPAGFVANASDCNDSDPLIYPGAPERCNGLDDDCDGQVDETGSLVFYRDADGDGFGNPDSLVSVCVQPAGYVADGSDCDDQDPREFPGQVWYIDYDGDGYGSGDSLVSCLRPFRGYIPSELISLSGDCKDSLASVNPAAPEICNGMDDDCDGLVDDADPSVGLLSAWYQDADNDGFGNPLVSDSSCAQPAGYVSNALDCDDNDALAFPGQVWHKDNDGDGYGVGQTLVQCARPAGYVLLDSLVSTSGDCNDNDPLVNPEAQRLEFAGLLNFDTSLVYPFTGSQYTTFQFMVEYFDASDATPAFQYPQIVLDYEGNGSVIDANDRIIPMSEYDVNDDHTNDGKLYVATINNLPTGVQWQTSVRSVISGCTTSTGPFNYPDVLIQPDLQIYADDIQFSDPNPDVSSQLTINATITNVSDFAADSFLVILVNQYTPTTAYDSIKVTDLDPRSSITLNWVITTPVDPAWCPMQVIVDPLGWVEETNEANNSAVRPFVNGDYNVPGGILVSQLQANPSTAYAVYGARVTVSGKAEYVGTAVPLADPSVAGATVNLSLTQTGQAYTTTTNSQGYFQLSIPVPLSAGPYDVQGYITDYTLDTTFTIGFTVENPPCNPDLVPQVSVPKSVFLQGESVVATFYVNNYGCDNAGASVLRTSYSGNPSLTQNHNIPALSVGGSDQVSRTFALNTPGYYTICGTADADGDVNEGVMEYNNLHCVSIRVLPAVPDIRPSFGPASSAYDCNHTGSFRFGLENIGGLATGPFLTEVRVILDGDTLDTLQVSVPDISAQGVYNFNLPWNAVVPGTYSFLVLADVPITSGGVVDEGPFEHNNAKLFNQQVLACKPNLVLRDCGVLDVDPMDPFQGTAVTYTARLSNIGNDTAFAGYDVRFMFADSSFLDTMVTVDLPPYQSTEVRLTGQTAPVPATGNLTVIADPLNAVDEQYESDNTASGELCWDFELLNIPSNCPGNDNNLKYTLHETADINVGLKVNHLYDASLMKVSFKVIMPNSPDTLLLAVVDVTNVEQTCNCPRIVSLPFTFIFSQIGTYTFIMEADTGDVYAECNEGNNIFIKVIEITDLPDLRTLSQYINPSVLNPDPGDPVTFDLTYENIGYSNIGDQMSLKMLVNEVPFYTATPVMGLVKGDDTTVTIPTPWIAPAVPGVYVIRSIIDSEDDVVESNEMNNEATRAIIVGDAPNLLFRFLEPDESNPQPGQPLVVEARILNDGDAACAAEVHLFYVDNANAEQLIGSTSINVLAGDSADVAFTWPSVLDPVTTLVARILNTTPQESNSLDNEATASLGGLQLSFVTVPACNGDSTGSITVTVTGGDRPYFYDWSHGAADSSITGTPGTYYLTVRDQLGREAVSTPVIPDEGGVWYYPDYDGDGYGDAAYPLVLCEPLAGYVMDSTDCDDADSLVNPSAVEICGNGIDDNCNGEIDETGCFGCFNGLYFNAEIVGDTNYCEGDTVRLTALVDTNGSFTYAWMPSSGLSCGTDCFTSILAPGTHQVSLVVYSSDGCYDTANVLVHVSALPVVAISGPAYVVIGDTAILNASVTADYPVYLWSTGDTTSSIAVSPSSNTVYSLTVTDAISGCSATDTFSLGVRVRTILDLKVYLQGAQPGASGMSTTLNTLGLLPLDQPYDTLSWSYGGTESLSSIPATMTDWVLVELRSATNVVAARKAAWLASDGQVHSADGLTGLLFEVPAGNYYIAIKHRNHLPVMSALPLTLSDSLRYDFSDTASYPVYGRCVIRTASGLVTMISGDINRDNALKYSGPSNDRSFVQSKIGSILPSATLTSTVNGYFIEDLNMNGVLKYSGPQNDPSLIQQNLLILTSPPLLNSVFIHPVPQGN